MKHVFVTHDLPVTLQRVVNVAWIGTDPARAQQNGTDGMTVE